MAEVLAAIGIVASVAQLADYGFKLSLKLYTFSSTVSSASDSIKSLSSDVSLTSTVLQELCLIIKSDEESHVVSDAAIHATSQTVKDCLAVFEQLDEALDKSMKGIEEKSGKRVMEKLKWPFKQPKMDLLRGNLDRLKASLTLMLQVLSYARDVSSRKSEQSSLVYQKHLIESLARSERDMKRKFLNMQRVLEYEALDRDFYSTMNHSVHIRTSRDVPTSGNFTPNQTSVDRSLPRHVEPKSLSFETIDPPPVKPRALIVELLLCFQLLNDILGYHLAVSKLSDIAALGYDDLRGALVRVQDQEFRRLEAQHMEAPIYVRAEAVKNLQTRLRELARAGFLTKRETASKEDLGAGPGRFMESEQVDAASFIGPAQLETHEHQLPVNLEEAVPYDPYIPRPSTTNSSTSDSRTAAIQAEIDSTVGIMRDNINKVSERGDRLDSLQDKTDNLHVSAQGFRRGANRVRKAQWRVDPLSAVGWLGMVGAEAVKGVGTGVVNASKGIGEAIYNAGEKFLVGVEGQVESEEYNDEFPSSPVRIVGGRFEDARESEYETRDEDEHDEGYENIEAGNLVDDLLAQWTTLSVQERDVGSRAGSEEPSEKQTRQ